jgi:hypothetical protein
MAAVAMSAHGVAFKQGMMSLGKSEFAGKVVKQSASSSAAAAVPASTFVSVRASGYDEELVKTAVRVSIFLPSSSAFHFFVSRYSFVLVELNSAVVFLSRIQS